MLIDLLGDCVTAWGRCVEMSKFADACAKGQNRLTPKDGSYPWRRFTMLAFW
jgi:hypothetical protein